MKQSDIRHLRRLLAWVKAEIGQSPDEMVKTMAGIADALGLQETDLDEAAKARLVQAHDAARSVPQYIRAAIKALEKTFDSGPVVPQRDTVIEGPAQGWGSSATRCTDELPPERQRVLLFGKFGLAKSERWVIGWRRDGEYFMDGIDGVRDRVRNVTFWMPQPDRPDGLQPNDDIVLTKQIEGN